MTQLIAILLPPVAMLMSGRPILALLSLLLMLTLIGWIPAAIWALAVVNDAKAKGRHNEMMKEMRKGV